MDNASESTEPLLQEVVPAGKLTKEEAARGVRDILEVLKERGKRRTATIRGYERVREEARRSGAGPALEDGFGDGSLGEDASGLVSALWCYKREELIARSGGLVEGQLIADVSSLRKLASSLVACAGKLWHQKASREIEAVVEVLGSQTDSKAAATATAGEERPTSPSSPSVRSTFEAAREDLCSLCARIYREPSVAIRSLEEKLLPLYLRPAERKPPGVAAPTYTQGSEERRCFRGALQKIVGQPEKVGSLKGFQFLGYSTALRREALRASQASLEAVTTRYLSSLTAVRGKEERQQRESERWRLQKNLSGSARAASFFH